MQHPFQCVAAVRGGDAGQDGFLVTACGPRLLVLNLASNEIVCEWSAEETSADPEHKSDDTEERPAKKQKTSSNKKPPKANKAPQKASNIINLTVSPSQTHLVAVTDDKSIRVFSIASSSSGSLLELSRRCMPKRPCAIQVLPDNTTLLCGDKFGDVYSLPLLPSSAEEPTPPVVAETPKGGEVSFKPSATPLTVHSARNLAALSQQQSQKNFTPRKDTLSSFANTLLLGHVSMLTDMCFVSSTPPGEGGDGKKRDYILTADRDEHIRLSRAPPQSHVIEGFCLGHTSFISKICPVDSGLLVSGGGDPWLGIWDWTHCTLLRKFNLLHLVQKVAGQESTTQVAVNGIWKVGTGSEEGVLITCERVPAVFFLPLPTLTTSDSDDQQSTVQTIPLPHNPLSLALLPSADKLLISTDARVEGESRLICFHLSPSSELWEECPTWAEEKLDAVNSHVSAKGGNRSEKEVDAFLYTVGNLRKRGVVEEGGGEEDVAADGGGEEDVAADGGGEEE